MYALSTIYIGTTRCRYLKLNEKHTGSNSGYLFQSLLSASSKISMTVVLELSVSLLFPNQTKNKSPKRRRECSILLQSGLDEKF